MNIAKWTASCAVLAICLAAPAAADWNEGEPFKMHFPQLPDPEGWDVLAVSPKVLADDWLSPESGPVSDVHFWGSWREDRVGKITSIHLSIHDNVPGPPSHPGKLLWRRDFSPGQWKERLYGKGKQGWFDPNTGKWRHPDHELFFQYNIIDILEPFTQEEGNIYWLDISVKVAEPERTQWGWKTSLDHWEDDAVWGDFPDPKWLELRDPRTQESLDMAFVITPEPASLMLLLFASLLAVPRMRR